MNKAIISVAVIMLLTVSLISSSAFSAAKSETKTQLRSASVKDPVTGKTVDCSSGSCQVKEGGTVTATFTCSNTDPTLPPSIVQCEMISGPPGSTFSSTPALGTTTGTFTWANAGPPGTYIATFQAIPNPTNVFTLTITVDETKPKPFNTGVCVRDPSAAACPSIFEKALIDFENLKAKDQKHWNILATVKCGFEVQKFLKGSVIPPSKECQGILIAVLNFVKNNPAPIF